MDRIIGTALRQLEKKGFKRVTPGSVIATTCPAKLDLSDKGGRAKTEVV